jgi:hypothetical protein
LWPAKSFQIADDAPITRRVTDGSGACAPPSLCTLIANTSRFSCCDKVFPCDRCHDESADHTIEHANRMLWYVLFLFSFSGQGTTGLKTPPQNDLLGSFSEKRGLDPPRSISVIAKANSLVTNSLVKHLPSLCHRLSQVSLPSSLCSKSHGPC